MIPTLIDKQDSFEIVRDKIALILATETANQQILATAASKDSALWKLRVFSERTNPWEQFLNEQTDQSPLINVWYDNSNFEKGSSNVMERQKATGVFNIDCIGFGISEDDPGGGHETGDEQAALNLQRAIRLVRNILMAAEYTYLELRGTVWSRWTQSITQFQPEVGKRAIQQIIGARVAFQVVFNELSPQVAGETLELVTVDIKRAENGEILVEADYEYPLP